MEIKPTKTFQARGWEAARAGSTFFDSETIVTDLQLINSYTGIAKTDPTLLNRDGDWSVNHHWRGLRAYRISITNNRQTMTSTSIIEMFAYLTCWVEKDINYLITKSIKISITLILRWPMGALTQWRRLQPPSKANKNPLPSSIAPSAVSRINFWTMSKSAASDRHAIT